ncbi:sodium channel protein type 4 subunit alpha B-like [Xyrichtys novacula]|uniref:Sodium channel protein type 4 subunit alpha B-like n=1 Tax=Xyrichtys novacula TaxID=13765 RepID=A0AAV1F4L5_XYRNO|nr:sodium channel protein type 4 subunit alpha B-like [Xyrichtys novacula]
MSLCLFTLKVNVSLSLCLFTLKVNVSLCLHSESKCLFVSLSLHSEGKCLFVTEVQMKLIKDLKTRLSRSVQTSGLRPQSSCRARLFDLVTSSWFAVVMVTVICLNMVVLMIESYDQSMEMEEVLYWFHFSLFIIFFIEFILKVGALGRPYFTSGWNILDFVVLLMSFIGIFIADLVEKYFVAPHVFPIFRLARVAQVIHLLPWCDGIRKLLWAFVMSLPAVCNISVIFCVLTFSFSIFAMFNFALLKKMAIVDDMYNFETFRNSLTCLILTSYSSDWFGLLLPLLATPPDCDPFIESPGLMTTGDCGNPGMGVAFFTTFIILSSLLLLYLNIAVILETFDSEEHLSDHDLDMFYNTWRTFDRDASRSIQYSELSDFCSSLKDPLRIPKPNSIRLTHMDLPLLPGDKICCEDILVSLSSQVFGDSSGEDSLKTRLNEKFTADSAKVSCDPISSTLQRKQEEVAASVIQRAFRKRLQKHGDGEGTEGSVGGAKGGSGV